MIHDEFDDVAAIARESLVWRLVSWSVGIWRGAWHDAAAVHAVRSVWRIVNERSVAERVRIVAVAVMFAAAGYGIGSTMLPRYPQSGLPMAWFVTLGVLALLVAAMPDAFARAWKDKVGHPKADR